jgi:hypothetical protein
MSEIILLLIIYGVIGLGFAGAQWGDFSRDTQIFFKVWGSLLTMLIWPIAVGILIYYAFMRMKQ